MTLGGGSFRLVLPEQGEVISFQNSANRARTVLPCLYLAFVEVPHADTHNHRLVRPSDMQLRRIYLRFLCRELDELEGISYLLARMAGPHSSTTMLEVNNGLGSSGKVPRIALHA